MTPAGGPDPRAVEEARPNWPWREYLTDDERQTLVLADAAKAEWERLNALRPRIVNRAIQRAKYAARALSPDAAS